MLTEETISDVYGIVNERFAEMIEGPDRQMYFTALFLDFRYIGSNIFTRRNINILLTTIQLPAPAGANSHNLYPAAHDTPDSDLRASLPAYERAGGYLASTLVHEINSGRAPEVFDHYDNVQTIFSEFRFQLMNYTRQNAPFDRYNNVSLRLEYWKKLSRHSDAQILAYLAIKLFSIVPNSMAEERTVSSFTKLNSPERGRQKSSTIVHMTQIKRHEQRLMKAKETLPPPTPPTMRFRDLSDYVKGLGCPTPVTEDLPEVSDTSISQGPASDGNGVDTWEVEAGFDEEVERPAAGSRAGFEVVEAEHVNLPEPFLLDLLSEIPVAGANLPFPPDCAYNAPSRSGGEKQPLVAEAFTF